MDAILILGNAPANSLSPTLVQAISMLAGPVTVAVIILGIMLIKLKATRMRYDVIMKAMEKGLPLPESFYSKDSRNPATRWIRSVALASALVPGGILLFIVGLLRTDGQVQGMGAAAFLVGVAFLVWGLLIRKHGGTAEPPNRQGPPTA